MMVQASLRGCVLGAIMAAGIAAEPPATVAAQPAGTVVLALAGEILDPDPVGHAPPMAWVPVASAAPEGSRIRTGEPLFGLKASTIQRWARESAGDLAEALAKRDRNAANAATTAGELEATIAATRIERSVLAARLATVDADRERQVRIQRLVAQRTAANAQAAHQRADGMRALAARQAASQDDLAAAERDARLADADAALDQAALDLAAEGSTALTRARLSREIARIDATLGGGGSGDGGGGGLQARLQVAVANRARSLEVASSTLDRLLVQDRRRQAALADPFVRATADGVVHHRDGRLWLGSKQGMTPCSFVLRDGRLAARFRLPESWLPLLAGATGGNGAGVAIEVPGGAAVRGRLAAIAPSAAPDRDGAAFQAEIVFDGPTADAGLRPGMHLACRLELVAPAGSCLVPGWLLARRDPPAVLAGDGRLRPLAGIEVGGALLTWSGIAPGEPIRTDVPTSVARPVAAGQRVAGPVEPGLSNQVRLRGEVDDWQVVWSEQDGRPVAAGAVVARLTRTGGWFDEQRAAAILANARVQAVAQLAIARLEATADRAQAAIALAEAEAAADLAILAEVSDVLPPDPLAPARAGVASRRAEARLLDAGTVAAQISDEQVATTVSGNARDAARRNVAEAELRLSRTRLDQAAAVHAADGLAPVQLAMARRAAIARRDAELLAWRAAQTRYQQAVAGAADGYRRALQAESWEREVVEGGVVTAPVAGRLLHDRPDGGSWLVGETVSTPTPYRIPVGESRLVRLLVPAGIAARLRQGQELRLAIPAIGAQVGGRVRIIGSALIPGERRSAADELRGDDRAVRITVALEAPGEVLARIPYGCSAEADLGAL